MAETLTQPIRRILPGIVRKRNKRGRVTPLSVGVLGGVILILFFLPLVTGSRFIPLLLGVLVVAMFTYAWSPVAGILGDLSVAQLISWGAGGYVFVMTYNAEWPLWASALFAIALGAAISVVVVVLSLVAKIDGLYLFVFTLVAVYLVSSTIKTWDFVGGNVGIPFTRIPFKMETLYFICVGFLALLFAFNWFLMSTRLGLTWFAIRDDPARAASLGWSRAFHKIVAYAITGALCAIGGALQVAGTGYITAETGLPLPLVVTALLAIYVGGPGTLLGPLFGVILLEGLSTITEAGNSTAEAGHIAQMVQYGAALVIVVIILAVERRRKARSMVAAGRADLDIAEIPEVEIGDTSEEPLLNEVAENEYPLINIGSGTTNRGSFTVTNLAKSFGGLQVLRDVSFTVSPGQILGLVGPNGAGKSTICNIIAGSLRPSAGTVQLGDRSVAGLPSYQRARIGLGRTFQTPSVFPTLTLLENVKVASTEASDEEVRQLLNELAVPHVTKLGEHASLLERRMVEVARVILQRPAWVLLDEPLAGLATEEHKLVIGAALALAKAGSAVLIIEHLVSAIAPITDRMVVLDGGVLIADGNPHEVLRDPLVVDAYLGAAADTAQEEAR